jgi:hypothetical protein
MSEELVEDIRPVTEDFTEKISEVPFEGEGEPDPTTTQQEEGKAEHFLDDFEKEEKDSVIDDNVEAGGMEEELEKDEAREKLKTPALEPVKEQIVETAEPKKTPRDKKIEETVVVEDEEDPIVAAAEGKELKKSFNNVDNDFQVEESEVLAMKGKEEERKSSREKSRESNQNKSKPSTAEKVMNEEIIEEVVEDNNINNNNNNNNPVPVSRGSNKTGKTPRTVEKMNKIKEEKIVEDDVNVRQPASCRDNNNNINKVEPLKTPKKSPSSDDVTLKKSTQAEEKQVMTGRKSVEGTNRPRNVSAPPQPPEVPPPPPPIMQKTQSQKSITNNSNITPPSMPPPPPPPVTKEKVNPPPLPQPVLKSSVDLDKLQSQPSTTRTEDTTRKKGGKKNGLKPKQVASISKKDEDKAAIKIQSLYRGHRARVSAGKMKGEKIQTEEKAAVKIQSAYRGHRVRKEIWEGVTEDIDTTTPPENNAAIDDKQVVDGTGSVKSEPISKPTEPSAELTLNRTQSSDAIVSKPLVENSEKQQKQKPVVVTVKQETRPKTPPIDGSTHIPVPARQPPRITATPARPFHLLIQKRDCKTAETGIPKVPFRTFAPEFKFADKKAAAEPVQLPNQTSPSPPQQPHYLRPIRVKQQKASPVKLAPIQQGSPDTKNLNQTTDTQVHKDLLNHNPPPRVAGEMKGDTELAHELMQIHRENQFLRQEIARYKQTTQQTISTLTEEMSTLRTTVQHLQQQSNLAVRSEKLLNREVRKINERVVRLESATGESFAFTGGASGNGLSNSAGANLGSTMEGTSTLPKAAGQLAPLQPINSPANVAASTGVQNSLSNSTSKPAGDLPPLKAPKGVKRIAPPFSSQKI